MPLVAGIFIIAGLICPKALLVLLPVILIGGLAGK
jgi:hypothetical protein